MRLLVILAALAVSFMPSSVRAGEITEPGEFTLFHRCYFEIPAHPKLRDETRLVVVSPGYWENTLRPAAYALLPSSGTFYHHRGWNTQNGPRAERTSRVWHEPVYIKVVEPLVVDPGQAVLLRSDTCWPDR